MHQIHVIRFQEREIRFYKNTNHRADTFLHGKALPGKQRFFILQNFYRFIVQFINICITQISCNLSAVAGCFMRFQEKKAQDFSAMLYYYQNIPEKIFLPLNQIHLFQSHLTSFCCFILSAKDNDTLET